MHNFSSDKGKQLDWTVRRSTDITLTLTFASYNTSVLTLTSFVYSGDNVVITPVIANGGITGIVTLALTNTQTNVEENEYFWVLKTSTPVDQVLFQGIFKVNDFTFDSENDNSTGSTTLDINGTSVTVSISTQ